MRFKRVHKYGAKRMEIDGYKFDSKAEARRYEELKLRLKAGEIDDIVIHSKYPIVYAGNKVCLVELDFEYFDKKRGEAVFEDVKGMDTAMSRLKRKLVKAFYGIDIEVVR